MSTVVAGSSVAVPSSSGGVAGSSSGGAPQASGSGVADDGTSGGVAEAASETSSLITFTSAGRTVEGQWAAGGSVAASSSRRSHRSSRHSRSGARHRHRHHRHRHGHRHGHRHHRETRSQQGSSYSGHRGVNSSEMAQLSTGDVASNTIIEDDRCVVCWLFCCCAGQEDLGSFDDCAFVGNCLVIARRSTASSISHAPSLQRLLSAQVGLWCYAVQCKGGSASPLVCWALTLYATVDLNRVEMLLLTRPLAVHLAPWSAVAHVIATTTTKLSSHSRREVLVERLQQDCPLPNSD